VALRVGVDAVELDRVLRLGPRATLLHRIAADGETEFADALDAQFGEPVGVAALLAVKEAVVKAVGGRPAGFTWRDAAVRSLPAPPAEAAAVLRGVANDLLAGTDRRCGVALTGSFAAGGGPFDVPDVVDVGGAAVHGLHHGHVVAAVVLWVPAHRMHRSIGNTLPPPTQRELGDPEQVPA